MKFGICVCKRCWPDFFSCNISPQSYSGFINYIGNTVLSLPLISESLCIIGLISSLNLIDKYNEEDIALAPKELTIEYWERLATMTLWPNLASDMIKVDTRDKRRRLGFI